MRRVARLCWHGNSCRILLAGGVNREASIVSALWRR